MNLAIKSPSRRDNATTSPYNFLTPSHSPKAKTTYASFNNKIMPFLLSNSGIELFIWKVQTTDKTFDFLIELYNWGRYLIDECLNLIFAIHLLNYLSKRFVVSKGIHHGKGKSYGSLDDTVILIEADESTPLLVDRRLLVDNGDGNNNNDIGRLKRLSIWSFASKSPSQSSDGGVSTKSFRSHFGELKVMAFALLLIAGLSIAIYLLIIESRLPSITFSLDLVHHDAWSVHKLPMGQQLNPHNVDTVIVTQTGSQNCDNPRECMHALQQMQDDYSYANNEELPYNFVIGCEGVAFEVRGWNYESGMIDVDQAHALVIGIMGNFDFFPPSQEILQTVRFLIIESMKRHKLMRSHQVLGLNKFCADCHDGEPLLK